MEEKKTEKEISSRQLLDKLKGCLDGQTPSKKSEYKNSKDNGEGLIEPTDTNVEKLLDKIGANISASQDQLKIIKPYIDEYQNIRREKAEEEKKQEYQEIYKQILETEEKNAALVEGASSEISLGGVAHTSSGISEEELEYSMLSIFGTEEETENFKKEADIEESTEIFEDDICYKRGKSRFAEYTHRSQAKDIILSYRSSCAYYLRRIILAVIVTAFALIFENAAFFGISLPAFADPKVYPKVYTLIALQITVLCVFLSWNLLLKGAKGLFTSKPEPSSLLFLITVCNLAYIAFHYFAEIKAEYILFVFPLSFMTLLSVFYEYLNVRREFMTFRIVCSDEQKQVVSRMKDNECELERESYEGYFEKSPAFFTVRKTDFIKNFFRREERYSKHFSIVIVFALLVCVSSVALFFFDFFRNNSGLVLSLRTAYTMLAIAMPACLWYSLAYPFYRASKKAYSVGSAFVGNSAFDEFSSSTVVSFSDREIFPASEVRLKNVKVYGNGRIDKVISCAAAIFCHTGGPLVSIFEKATVDSGYTKDVDLIDIEPDGIEAAVDGEHVFVGSAEFLERNCFYTEDRENCANNREYYMYMAIGREAVARIQIEYTIEPSIPATLSHLFEAGVCIAIKTFDPNINYEMLGNYIDLGKRPVKILKCRSLADKTAKKPDADGAVITKSKVKYLLATMADCDRTVSAVKAGVVISVVSMVSGIILATLCSILKMIPSVYSLYIVAFQIAFMIICYLISKLFMK